MPTILDALRMKDGGNTPADTITDFLRAHNDAPLTTGDSTIASYIANSPTYDPIAPVPSNDSQCYVFTMFGDSSARTYKQLTSAYTKKYKDHSLQGLYFFIVNNSPSSLIYPTEDQEFYFQITDANDVNYRVPGAYTKSGDGISISTFVDNEIIPNQGTPGAYIFGRPSAGKPVHMMLVSLPWETADQIIIKKFRWYIVTVL